MHISNKLTEVRYEIIINKVSLKEYLSQPERRKSHTHSLSSTNDPALTYNYVVKQGPCL